MVIALDRLRARPRTCPPSSKTRCRGPPFGLGVVAEPVSFGSETRRTHPWTKRRSPVRAARPLAAKTRFRPEAYHGPGRLGFLRRASPAGENGQTLLGPSRAHGGPKCLGPDIKSRHNAAYWARIMAGFDFSYADRVPPARLNRVLWTGMMGSKSYPTMWPPRRRSQS
jgi:hypothetical protein